MQSKRESGIRAAAPGHAAPGMPVVIAFGLIACVLYGVGGGLRGDIGILLQPLARQCNLEYADVSFCIAVMQLVFGAVQPAFGIVASRRSNRFVLVLGAFLLGAGLLGMMAARSFAMLLLSLGVLFGLGAGALAFGLVLTSAIHFVGPDRAMVISGMLNAAAGLGSFAFAPLLQTMLQVAGVPGALLVMLAFAAALVPIAFAVTARDPKPARPPARDGRGGEGRGAARRGAQPDGGLRAAFRNRTFILLVAGFTTCGFHMVIIESHLFNQFVLDGIDAGAAAWAFSVYGIATIFGALLSGWLSTRVPKGRLLVFYYGFRAVWVAAFVFLMPKNLPFAILFSIGLGMTGDATVSPTSGLVNEQFPLKRVATLIGVLFFCHQVGAFLSAWLGGILLDITGGYAVIWAIDIAACTFAALMSSRIR